MNKFEDKKRAIKELSGFNASFAIILTNGENRELILNNKSYDKNDLDKAFSKIYNTMGLTLKKEDLTLFNELYPYMIDIDKNHILYGKYDKSTPIFRKIKEILKLTNEN